MWYVNTSSFSAPLNRYPWEGSEAVGQVVPFRCVKALRTVLFQGEIWLQVDPATHPGTAESLSDFTAIGYHGCSYTEFNPRHGI